jgi:Putative Ig domain
MKRGHLIGNILCAAIFSCVYVLGLAGCGGDSGPTPGSLAITTASLPEGILNQPYSASVSGSGGALPYTWSVSPALPANLSFDTTTGAITGTPTTAATTTHTFSLRDTSAPSQTLEQTLSLTIDPPLSITSTSLPDASIGAAYNQPVQTVGGIGALTFSIVLPGTGTLPPTLSLNTTTGMISGTPAAPAGTFPFTVRVADTGGQQDTQALSIRINPSSPPQITTTSLPGGTVGQSYNQRVQATGGIGSLAWSVSAGSLPVGLILEPSGPTGGTISGIPSSGGPSNFTVRATDSLGQTDTQALSITVTPFSITTTSLPPGSIGQAYSQPVQTIGGTAPLTFSIVPPGTLPPGLNLNPTTGVISGTPIVPAGTSSFTVRVADAGGRNDTQVLSITINLLNPPNITTTTLLGGTVGQPYNQTLQATGGVGGLTWSVPPGSLPAGLTLSPAGTISGALTSAGTFNFTVTVRDTLNQSDTQDLSIAVSAVLEITTTSLPAAKEGEAYTATLQSSGGVQPVSWSVDPVLPGGLSLNASTGEIAGTPAAGTAGTQGASTFTITAQDSSTPTPQTANKQLGLTIAPP